LTAIQMMHDMLKQQLPEDHPGLALLDQSRALTRQAVQETRSISYLLHPPMLDELGFASAAPTYVDGFVKRSGIDVRLRMPRNLRLPAAIETSLFRILQECLTNIVRHSGAKSAEVSLEATDGVVTFAVRDRGKGIPAAKLAKLRLGRDVGVGFGGMQARVRDLGGSLEVHSNETGTTVRINLPLSAAPQKASPSQPADDKTGAVS
jgi:signal transduction histidine kinase